MSELEDVTLHGPTIGWVANAVREYAAHHKGRSTDIDNILAEALAALEAAKEHNKAVILARYGDTSEVP